MGEKEKREKEEKRGKREEFSGGGGFLGGHNIFTPAIMVIDSCMLVSGKAF